MNEEYQPDGDGFGLPDSPHMEIMFDSLTDTVDQMDIAGTESLTLTPAQHYAQGVLSAAGIVSAAQVTGNEGIFSAIGDGFKAVYDYIVKTFKSIWDFFFNRDSAKEAEVAKTAVDENTKELQAAEAGTQTEEEANKQIAAMATVANAEGGDKALAEDLAEAKKGDLKEKRKAIHEALKTLPKLKGAAKHNLEKTIESAVKVKMAFTTKGLGGGDSKAEGDAADHLMGSNKTANDLVDLTAEITKFTIKDAHFITALKGATSINSIDKAIAFSKACSANIQMVKEFSDVVKGKKSKIEALLHAAEAKMKSAKDGKDKDALSKDIAALRLIVVMGTRLAKLIEQNYIKVKAASEAMNKVFCI
jgi:hypothetical protein